jgi:hypothetical protein
VNSTMSVAVSCFLLILFTFFPPFLFSFTDLFHHATQWAL